MFQMNDVMFEMYWPSFALQLDARPARRPQAALRRLRLRHRQPDQAVTAVPATGPARCPSS